MTTVETTVEPVVTGRINLRFATPWDAADAAPRVLGLFEHLRETAGFEPDDIHYSQFSYQPGRGYALRKPVAEELSALPDDTTSLLLMQQGPYVKHLDVGSYGADDGPYGTRLSIALGPRDGSRDGAHPLVDVLRMWPTELWPLDELAAAEIDPHHHLDVRWDDWKQHGGSGISPAHLRLFRTLMWRTVVPPHIDRELDWDAIEAVLPEGTRQERWHGMRLLAFPDCPWELPPEGQQRLWEPFRYSMNTPQDRATKGLTSPVPTPRED